MKYNLELSAIGKPLLITKTKSMIALSSVPQPAASARPYIPPAPEVPTPDLDLEAVEKRAIERFMREQMNKTGEVFSSERTPPGLFAYFDK